MSFEHISNKRQTKLNFIDKLYRLPDLDTRFMLSHFSNEAISKNIV